MTARSRTLEFEGTVHLPTNADDFTIMSRELKTIDASTFVRRTVEVVDGTKKSNLLEVKYTSRS